MTKRAKFYKTNPMERHLETPETDLLFTTESFTFTSRDISKLMLRTLYNLGFRESAAKLEEESGIKIITDSASLLFAHIRSGEWEQAIDVAKDLKFISKSQDDIMSIILELKYFELIETGNSNAALACLRTELSEHIFDITRLSELASFLLESEYCWNGVSEHHQHFYRSRDAVIGFIRQHVSSEEVVGDFRLEELMEEALLWQSSSNRSIRSPPPPSSSRHLCTSSLLVDMSIESPSNNCSLKLVPFSKLQHSDEVWCVAFSPDGRMIATGSADGKIKLWLAGNNSLFSTAIDCTSTAKSPLLLR